MPPRPVRAYPMNEVCLYCGYIGMNTMNSAPCWYPTDTWNVYCKPDLNLVGEADTMVISVNI